MLHGILKESIKTRPNGDISEEMIAIPFVAPLSIISNQPSYSQDSLNLKRRTGNQQVQRWEITTNLHPTNNTADSLVHAIIHGVHTSFYVTMPQVHALPGIESLNNTKITVPGNSYSTTITTVGTLTKGEFINIGASNKVYAVTSVSGGTATIFPALLSTVAVNDIVYRGRQVLAKVYYDMDTQIGLHYVDGVLADPGSVKLIEDL